MAVAKYTIQLHRASSDNDREKKFPALFAFISDCARRKSIKMHWVGTSRKPKRRNIMILDVIEVQFSFFPFFEMYGNFGQVVRSCESHSSAFITRSTSTPTLD